MDVHEICVHVRFLAGDLAGDLDLDVAGHGLEVSLQVACRAGGLNLGDVTVFASLKIIELQELLACTSVRFGGSEQTDWTEKEERGKREGREREERETWSRQLTRHCQKCKMHICSLQTGYKAT